jgi:hypothetical protein
MSTIKVNSIVPPNAGEGVSIDGLQMPTAGPLSNRNKIINGAMVIDQRNAGASVTSAGPIYTVDRWSWYSQSGSAHTIQQNTDAPAGFSNSLKVTVGTGASPSASHQNIVWQPIEGYNAANLGFGAAGASTVTLSFWVKSSLTGTFNAWFQNSASDRAYVSTYTISVANTWEQKSITIAGDTTGTWLKTNGRGLSVGWSLGCGSNFNATANTWTSSDRKSTSGATSVVGTSGATFYLTGVQLEVGSKATPFEHRSYGDELARCQRYLQRISGGIFTRYAIGGNGSLSTCYPTTFLKQTMRASPTVNFSAVGDFMVEEIAGSSNATVTGISANAASTDTIALSVTSGGSSTPNGAQLLGFSSNAFLEFIAEL